MPNQYTLRATDISAAACSPVAQEPAPTVQPLPPAPAGNMLLTDVTFDPSANPIAAALIAAAAQPEVVAEPVASETMSVQDAMASLT